MGYKIPIIQMECHHTFCLSGLELRFGVNVRHERGSRRLRIHSSEIGSGLVFLKNYAKFEVIKNHSNSRPTGKRELDGSASARLSIGETVALLHRRT